jgi:hypothetical protein
MKVAPAVKFEIDKVFDSAERIEKVLRDERPPAAAPEAQADAAPPTDDDDPDRDDD